MSAENDLALAYHMGYDDALAKRLPDASKAQVLAPYDLAAENAKLREQVSDACMQLGGAWVRCTELRELVRDLYEMAYPECPSAFEAAFADRMRELGVEVDG